MRVLGDRCPSVPARAQLWSTIRVASQSTSDRPGKRTGPTPNTKATACLLRSHSGSRLFDVQCMNVLVTLAGCCLEEAVSFLIVPECLKEIGSTVDTYPSSECSDKGKKRKRHDLGHQVVSLWTMLSRRILRCCFLCP